MTHATAKHTPKKARQTTPVEIVRVEVHNGCVDVLEKPRGIRLIVLDYDSLAVEAGADVFSERMEIKKGKRDSK